MRLPKFFGSQSLEVGESVQLERTCMRLLSYGWLRQKDVAWLLCHGLVALISTARGTHSKRLSRLDCKSAVSVLRFAYSGANPNDG